MKLINKNYNKNTIDTNEVWASLGWKNQEISEEFIKLTDEMVDTALRIAKPKSILVTGSLERKDGKLLFEGVELEGNSINDFLEGSNEAALLAVTLGIELDREIKKLEHTDLTKALLLDACASILIENICDDLSEEFESLIREGGQYTTERFSPGYGDMPLDIQPKLLKLLDGPRQLGLSTSNTFLLYPRKSVTAFIGIRNKQRKPMGNRCKTCILKGKCKFGLCKRNENELKETR